MNDIMSENTVENGKRHHHHSHSHGHSHSHSSSTDQKKKSLSQKLKKIWKSFIKKLLKDGGKKEMSLLLTIIIIMAVSVPVVIAVLDAINNFFTINR